MSTLNMVSMLETAGRFGAFAWASLAAVAASIVRPGETLRQLYLILIGSLPLGLVGGVALGVVIWLHLNGFVGRDNASKVPEYLALIIVLEFAPLGAGLVVAGRSGASLGAELSSMRLTEQVDALESMGLSPTRYLVGPRTLAIMVAMPIMTIYLGLFALVSSYVAEMSGGVLYSTQYVAAAMAGLEQAKLIPATLKTMVFGYLIGVAGCYCGLHAPAGAEGVGIAATRGVVVSTLLVLSSNVLLVKMIQLYG